VGNSSLGGVALDQLTAVASHEVAEGATDPDGGYGQVGWYDPRRGEIGDITEGSLTRLSDGFQVQEVAGTNDQPLSILENTTFTSTTSSLSGVAVSGTRRPTVTFTLTITPASGTALPTGGATLTYGNQLVAASPIKVVNGVATATFTISFNVTGSFTFNALYWGDTQFSSSVSNGVTVTVS
jgi:Bacterial Ig-like domain (group 3)